MYFPSDRFQEYKQKHLERKLAAARELGIKLPFELPASDAGCGKEAEDGGNKAEEKPSGSQEEQREEDGSTHGAGSVLANGHAAEPEQTDESSDRTGTGAGQIKSDSQETNGAVDVLASPSAPKSPLTWADVVSKPSAGTGSKAVNGVDSVAANGAAEESKH